MEFEPFSVTLERPLETARGAIHERAGFVIRTTYEDVTGIGEATPLAGWTESQTECRDALERASNVATELDWGVALARLDAPAARHGLSLAFADARARAARMPLYRSLGGPTQTESVPVNATLGAQGTPEQTASEARQLSEDGYRCLKVKVGTRSVEEDIERIRAIRDTLGDTLRIRVDVNGAWTTSEAETAVDALAALDVSYVEQPLPAGELEATRSLRNRGVDIALDESLATYDIETIIDNAAADVLVLKPMVLGGPDLTVTAARACREAGIEPVVSTTIDAVVARTAAVHVAASIPEIRPCGLATADWLATDIGLDPSPIENGRIHVPQEPGLGIEGVG